LEVFPEDTIEEIKEKICAIQGLKYDPTQRLIFDGMEVQDDMTVYDCNIQKGDTFHYIRKER